MESGLPFQSIRLYHNTVDVVPEEYEDVTEDVASGMSQEETAGGVSTLVRLTGGSVRVEGLTTDTSHYFWTEVIDSDGVSSGVIPSGEYVNEAGLVPEDFGYTGTDQTIAVVPGEKVKVKAWGAGGNYRDDGGGRDSSGGAGGYSEGWVVVPAGVTSATVMVGCRGRSGPDSDGVYGGGGGLGYDSDKGGGGGGGRSALRWGGEDVVTAGGGGGGGYFGVMNGGAGGGLTGAPASSSSLSGGTQSAGGTVPAYFDGSGPVDGSKYQGGWATDGWTGGSGGGGYYGGAGGGGTSGAHRGGGGGSGFVGRDGAAALSGTERGSASAPADPEWRTDTVSGVAYRDTRCLRGNGTSAAMRQDADYGRLGGGFGGERQHGRVVLRRIPPRA